MPSLDHEADVALFRAHPELVLEHVGAPKRCQLEIDDSNLAGPVGPFAADLLILVRTRGKVVLRHRRAPAELGRPQAVVVARLCRGRPGAL